MALDSANNGYNPTPQLQQVIASPDIRPIQQRDDVNSSKGYQLARQLGALAPEIDKAGDRMIASDKEAAANLVGSMSTADLAQKIKEDPLSVTGSPIFNATVNKLHYQNIADANQQQTMQQLATGNLTFPDDPENTKYDANGQINPNWQSGNQKLDAYLVDQRNQSLAGANEFGIAGYDSSWQHYTKAAQLQNSETLAKQSLDFASNTYFTSLQNAIGANTPDDKIQQNVKAVTDIAHLPSGALMPPQARKPAYEAIAFELIKSGREEGLKNFLDTPLDNGQSIRGVVGVEQAAKMEYEANKTFQMMQNKAAVQAQHQYVKQSQEQLTGNISKSLDIDGAGFLPAKVSMPTLDGDIKDVPIDSIKYSVFDQKTKGWSPEDRAVKAMNNNIDDLDAQSLMRAGFQTMGNVTTRGTDMSGNEKPAGEANQTYLQGYKQWEIYKNLPNGAATAARLAGTDANKSYEAVHALQNTLQMSPEEAALVVTNANANPKAMGDYRKQANSLVSVLQPSWWSKTFGDEMPIKGNVDQVVGDLATTMAYQVAAGGDPKSILKSMEDFIPNNYANVGGSLIPRRSIPNSGLESQVTGGSVAMFNRLKDEVAVKVGASQGINPEEVTVVPSYDGGSFNFMAGGQFLKLQGRPFVMTAKQVIDWERKDFPDLQADKAYESDRKAFKEKLTGNTNLDNMFEMGGSAFKNKVAIEDQYLYSNSGYRKLVQDGMAKKPLEEQRKWAKEQLSKGSSLYDNAAQVPTSPNLSGGK